MSKSYRLRTKVGVDRNIRININQDFDFLEILSLKLRQSDVYTRFCADYGVVAGRVVVNGGYGVPNANVSIFIPLDQLDENDPVISTLYPYKKPTDKNEDGYRYNLLPYKQTYGGHTPTGTFPTREDVLTRTEVLEVYEKYYKFTAKTNDSGDFMIIGVPLGVQTIVMDLDLSDMGCFSLKPSDLVRSGLGTPEQFDGESFKSSTDLDSLPQIVSFNKDIDVTSFWGEEDLCNIGITRTDFDLRDVGVQIIPQAIFMGSVFSSSEDDFMRSNCKPKKNTGNLCQMQTAPGRILALRQTIKNDINGQPVLEQYKLQNGGKVIDEDGTWLIEVPMNIDYVTTNEFGEQVISNDPSIGIPTKGRYRFRVEYQNEDKDNNTIMRADYLIPNIREYGWTNSGKYDDIDPVLQLKSYAFSLDWNEYADPQAAINCEDYFYEFNYNKVYTVANFLDRWQWGFNRYRHLGIKEIDSKDCNQINKPPVNDGVRNFDFNFFAINLFITILTPIIPALFIILHVLALIWPIFREIINLFIWLINTLVYSICVVVAFLSAKLKKSQCKKQTITKLKGNPFKRLSLPMLSYPDCESCPCEEKSLDTDSQTQKDIAIISEGNYSTLSNLTSVGSFSEVQSPVTDTSENINVAYRQFLSGIQTNQTYPKIVKLPIATYDNTNGGDNEQEINSTSVFYSSNSYDVTLAQSLNLANLRQRYFDNENVIQTTVINDTPNTQIQLNSDPFEDSVLILLCDSQTLTNITPGQLISFVNTDNIVDPNTTGGTINQFNTNNITGSTPYNANNLVIKQITYIKTDGTISQPINLRLKITSDGKEYKFKSGVEYFQLITGGTVSQFSALTQSTTNGTGLLRKYIFNKTQYIPNYPSYANVDTRRYLYPIKNIDDFENLEVLILSRGVDPYTDKQKIRYDLSKLFGYSSFGSGVIIEGDYYLNIPIQPNTVTTPTGAPSWWNNFKSPESHDSIDNTNISLYHKPYGFDVDTTKFTSFTTNASYYYNSTDRSTLNEKAYSDDLTTLGYYTNNTVYASAYDSYNTSALNVLGLQWGETISTLDAPYVWLWDSNYYNSFTAAVSSTDPINNSIYRSGPGLAPKTNFYSNNSLTNVINVSSTTYFRVKFFYSNRIYVVRLSPNYGIYGVYDITNVDPNDVSTIISQPPTYPNGYVTTLSDQGYFEGGSLMVIDRNSTLASRVFSFAYHTNNSLSPVTITNNNNLILRSDRLPTSDVTEVSGNTSFSLHLNNNFQIYLIDESGNSTVVPADEMLPTDQTYNAQDLTGDTANSYTDAILNTLTCEGMTTITCYSGSGSNFGVETPCTDPQDNFFGQSTEERVNGGCYYFVDQPLVVSIPNDIRYFREWRGRFRLVLAACRGVFSQVFQNNWLNGSLYMFSFKRQTIFNVKGEPKKYKFCGTTQSIYRKGQGPIYYSTNLTVNSTTYKGLNSLFYRSTPYDGNNFVGQIPQSKPLGFGPSINADFISNNQRNLFFPTTIVDLGPKDLFTKEICNNPSFEGYTMNSLQSTSYNDPSDILQLAFISRLVNKNWLGQAVNLVDQSINRYFSRSGDRLDGDIVQLFSINSEYGVVPFGDEEYNDSDLFIQGGNFNALLGIFFSADTNSRTIISPGIQTFSENPPLYNSFGYPKSQEVPMYKWESKVPLNGNQKIFGTDNNDWDTNVSNGKYYSQKYQSLSFKFSPTSDYFNTTPTGQRGFIYNEDINGVGDPNWNGSINTPQKFIVGAPYHFYFGLYKGKTALNKFISKYVE